MLMLVAIALERSPSLVVALLGILKAGAAYLPLDLSYPAQRLAHILADARPRALLTQPALLAQHFAPPAAGAATWSVPASWSTSQTAARRLRGSESTPSPMSSGCARPSATVDRAGLSGVPTIRWASRRRE